MQSETADFAHGAATLVSLTVISIASKVSVRYDFKTFYLPALT